MGASCKNVVKPYLKSVMISLSALHWYLHLLEWNLFATLFNQGIIRFELGDPCLVLGNFAMVQVWVVLDNFGHGHIPRLLVRALSWTWPENLSNTLNLARLVIPSWCHIYYCLNHTKVSKFYIKCGTLLAMFLLGGKFLPPSNKVLWFFKKFRVCVFSVKFGKLGWNFGKFQQKFWNHEKKPTDLY